MLTASDWLLQRFLQVAMLALAVMMMAIVADVFMRYVFNAPIVGVFDVVEICLTIVVFFSLGTAIAGFHEIVIDLLDHVVPARWITRLKQFAALLSMGVLIFIFISMITPAIQSHQYNEIRLELNMPVWIIWVIALVGMMGGILASMMNVFRQLLANGNNSGRRSISVPEDEQASGSGTA